MENIHDDEETSKSVRITIQQFDLLKRYTKMLKPTLLQPNNVKA